MAAETGTDQGGSVARLSPPVTSQYIKYVNIGLFLRYGIKQQIVPLISLTSAAQNHTIRPAAGANFGRQIFPDYEDVDEIVISYLSQLSFPGTEPKEVPVRLESGYRFPRIGFALSIEA
jgi:hypothetical protein